MPHMKRSQTTLNGWCILCLTCVWVRVKVLFLSEFTFKMSCFKKFLLSAPFWAQFHFTRKFEHAYESFAHQVKPSVNASCCTGKTMLEQKISEHQTIWRNRQACFIQSLGNFVIYYSREKRKCNADTNCQLIWLFWQFWISFTPFFCLFLLFQPLPMIECCNHCKIIRIITRPKGIYWNLCAFLDANEIYIESFNLDSKFFIE